MPSASSQNTQTIASVEAAPAIEAIETRLGGRLGVTLIGSDGVPLLNNRPGERFAMCSTFKAPLAAAILHEVDAGRLRLDQPIAISRDDLVPFAPVLSRTLDEGKTEMRLDRMIAAVIRASDNAIANLLLERIGGPEGLTRFMREQGDDVTRLDRREPELNENRPGDPRDTTNPMAMAKLMHSLLLGNPLHQGSRAILIRHMILADTGLQRIRAGMPEGWIVGDKTGTCGSAYNDVAIFWDPNGAPYILSIYSDLPDTDSETAQGALADIGRIAAAIVRERRMRLR